MLITESNKARTEMISERVIADCAYALLHRAARTHSMRDSPLRCER
jgi:hypothetical protein